MKNSVEDLALVQNQELHESTQGKAPRFKFLRFSFLKSK